jgi:hypothetical protein
VKIKEKKLKEEKRRMRLMKTKIVSLLMERRTLNWMMKRMLRVV